MSAFAENSESVNKLNESGLINQSQKYSDSVVEKNQNLKIILKKLNLKYLHQLDPNKIYNLNTSTNRLTILDAKASNLESPNSIDFGFGTPTATILSGPSSIIGQARTVVTCPLAGQWATVAGWMASPRSRDPVAGIKNGVIVVDNFLDTIAEANFGILKLPGGARNISNRTTLESTHTGSCGNDFRATNLVTTWPPLRIEMVIDDTGSMGGELDGMKTALAAFITSQNETQYQRELSYELISFKDSPSLRLLNTTDTAAALAAVQGLTASGGDDCPEDSIGALSMALNGVETDESSERSLLLVTDASPKYGSVDSIISRAKAVGVKVNVMLSGDCVGTTIASNISKPEVINSAILSAKQEFQRLASETGGVYIYKQGGTAEEYADILLDIFDSTTDGTPLLKNAMAEGPLEGLIPGERIYRFEVPQGASSLHIITYGGVGNLSLYASFNSVPNATSYFAKSTRSGNSEAIHIDSPQAGVWYIKLIGESDYSGAYIRANYTN